MEPQVPCEPGSMEVKVPCEPASMEPQAPQFLTLLRPVRSRGWGMELVAGTDYAVVARIHPTGANLGGLQAGDRITSAMTVTQARNRRVFRTRAVSMHGIRICHALRRATRVVVAVQRSSKA